METMQHAYSLLALHGACFSGRYTFSRLQNRMLAGKSQMHGYQRAVRKGKRGKRWKPCSVHLGALAPHKVRSAGRHTRLQLGIRMPARKAYSMRCQCCYMRAAWVSSLSFLCVAYCMLVPVHLRSTGRRMILQFAKLPFDQQIAWVQKLAFSKQR